MKRDLSWRCRSIQQITVFSKNNCRKRLWLILAISIMSNQDWDCHQWLYPQLQSMSSALFPPPHFLAFFRFEPVFSCHWAFFGKTIPTFLFTILSFCLKPLQLKE